MSYFQRAVKETICKVTGLSRRAIEAPIFHRIVPRAETPLPIMTISIRRVYLFFLSAYFNKNGVIFIVTPETQMNV